jgi:ABC-2 type transport system ATP-binding protein
LGFEAGDRAQEIDGAAWKIRSPFIENSPAAATATPAPGPRVPIDIRRLNPFWHEVMAEALPAGLRVRELTRSYGPVMAARDLSFEVAAGEVFGLLGPNGAGKTTTLECVLGLRCPDTGSITIGGIDAIVERKKVMESVGALLHPESLQDRITPRQALALFASFYRNPANIDDLLRGFALMAKADARFDSLSEGQKRRLFLALALVNDPQLVVLDEPTAGLDPQSRQEIHQMIIGMRAAGRSILMSTHNLEEAHLLCDRIGILNEGKIVALARPGDLVAGASHHPRVILRTAIPLTAADVRLLPGVVNWQPKADGWVLATTDVNGTVIELVKMLEAEENTLLELQIHRPSLEDVFVELTGRDWSTPGQEDAG